MSLSNVCSLAGDLSALCECVWFELLMAMYNHCIRTRTSSLPLPLLLLSFMIIMIPSSYSQDFALEVFQRMDNPRNERNSIILTCENSSSGFMINDARIFVNDTEVPASLGTSGYFIHITRETEGTYSCRSSDGAMRSNTDVLLGEFSNYCIHQSTWW